MRSLSLALPINRLMVHLTSAAVNGFPSCHLTPCRSGKVSSVPSSFHAQPVARSGTIERKLFCGTCWSNMTRLLNTPDIGRLTACVDSSSGDMLAGLSKCPSLKMPPGFWANAILADANPTRSEPAAASTRGPLFISEYLLLKEAGLEYPPFPARLSDRRFFDQLPAGRATAV